MQSFEELDTEKYYLPTDDDKIMEEESSRMNLIMPKGAQLMASYYQVKYSCHIQVLESNESTKKTIKEFKNQYGHETEIRAGFVKIGALHTKPIIYLKNKNHEALFYADSLGIEIEKIKNKKNPIDTYYLTNARQSDHNTCKVHSICFTKDAIAKDEEGNYKIPNLLDFLHNYSVKVDSSINNNEKMNQNNQIENGNIYTITKLPDHLLKTSQKSAFIKKYSTEQPKTSLFLEKHYVTCTIINDFSPNEKKKVNLYTKKKSLKFSHKMNVQFYLNQMKELYSEKNWEWDHTLELDFLKFTKDKVDLEAATNEFINQQRQQFNSRYDDGNTLNN